ncbi:LTV-domain-containing protein [Hymenopellis radicata]|nr:LTV-domain-containing protein [Hymenopellis radicata]
MPPKSIFRQPGAKHFQLVHRSQRDPLIHDPDATAHVLKPVVRDNEKKGKTRAELEAMLDVAEVTQETTGEAALYGIYYDDTEYDYMQHLRPVGVQEDGVDSILIEAPSTSKKSKNPTVGLRDLPKGTLPSSSELPRTYESQQAVPDSISGFQPDMDPHLRQVLEALEDDAFVEDDLEDDFFGELVGEGERDSDQDIEFPFHEDGILDGVPQSHAQTADVEEANWEARFARFKQTTHGESAPKSDFGEDESEGGDTVSGLPNISVIGRKGKKRRKGSSEASGYSMSSSSMYRNEALQTLDERFDQVMLKQYHEDDQDDHASVPDDSDSDDDDAPELITTRDDFESMMDQFLNDYEILGRKMKPKLQGDSGAEKLETLRRAMGQDQRVRESYSDEDTPEEDLFPELEEDKKDRWDCETILSTYSNLENHPRLIRERNPKPVPQIILDPKTGLPSVVAVQPPKRAKPAQAVIPEEPPSNYIQLPSGDSLMNHTPDRHQETVARPRNESPESKKARKAAVKLERATRRAQKKATKEEFGSEFKVQAKMQDGQVAMRKL